MSSGDLRRGRPSSLNLGCDREVFLEAVRCQHSHSILNAADASAPRFRFDNVLDPEWQVTWEGEIDVLSSL